MRLGNEPCTSIAQRRRVGSGIPFAFGEMDTMRLPIWPVDHIARIVLALVALCLGFTQGGCRKIRTHPTTRRIAKVSHPDMTTNRGSRMGDGARCAQTPRASCCLPFLGFDLCEYAR
ncbi:MAG: hypothetical protein CMJ78_18025 [Planctomycetaceae bacterium]|nr:hypothetical protein [Planctomycetaceae bacterium]